MQKGTRYNKKKTLRRDVAPPRVNNYYFRRLGPSFRFGAVILVFSPSSSSRLNIFWVRFHRIGEHGSLRCPRYLCFLSSTPLFFLVATFLHTPLVFFSLIFIIDGLDLALYAGFSLLVPLDCLMDQWSSLVLWSSFGVAHTPSTLGRLSLASF